MNGLPQLRTALVHHWLVNRRGGESVFDALLHMFPHAEVFTLVYDRERASPVLRERIVHTSLLQKLPSASRWYPYYLPFFAQAAKHLDLSDYELVISSDTAIIKGVQTRPGTLHVCYCHSPMRYVWSGYDTYRERLGPVSRRLLPVIAEYLRRRDFEAAQKVSYFVANSRNVASRIARYYNRESTVIYPPVDTRYFVPASNFRRSEDYWMLVSPLVPYKRVDLVVEAFNRTGRPLVVIGDGNERPALERLARSNIRILGPQSRAVIRSHLQNCKAFVFGGEEDFGIVMAEALACGSPILAYGRGGASEIVDDGRTGILFEEQSVDSLLNGMSRLERKRFDPYENRQSVLRFSQDRFVEEFNGLISEIGKAGSRRDIA
jgi:glycosyltransferase involved in cell wall biosynthesis